MKAHLIGICFFILLPISVQLAACGNQNASVASLETRLQPTVSPNAPKIPTPVKIIESPNPSLKIPTPTQAASLPSSDGSNPFGRSRKVRDRSCYKIEHACP